MLKLMDLKKNYRDFSLECTLEVKPGMITGFIGPNGAGKSTTFKAILGLISHDGGRIELFGKECGLPGPAEKQRIGAVLAEAGFSGELTLRDAGQILKAFYPTFDGVYFTERAKALSLPMDKKIREFSTGMNAKARVLCAVCHRAELLLLDEPTTGLDVAARDQILEILREYMAEDENRAILISSHISGDLEQLCDDFYMISNGRLICHEETDRLLSDYALIKVSGEDLAGLDPVGILRRRRESFGWSLLTDQKRFYSENYPRTVIERIDLDGFIMMMLKGEKP